MITMPIVVDGVEYMPQDEVLKYFGIKNRATLFRNFPELKAVQLRNDKRFNYYRRDEVEAARANPITERQPWRRKEK